MYGFLKSEFFDVASKVFVLPSFLATKIALHGKGSLGRASLKNYEFLVGPAYIERIKDWCALIVNIPKLEVSYIDPFGTTQAVVTSAHKNWQ